MGGTGTRNRSEYFFPIPLCFDKASLSAVSSLLDYNAYRVVPLLQFQLTAGSLSCVPSAWGVLLVSRCLPALACSLPPNLMYAVLSLTLTPLGHMERILLPGRAPDLWYTFLGTKHYSKSFMHMSHLILIWCLRIKYCKYLPFTGKFTLYSELIWWLHGLL